MKRMVILLAAVISVLMLFSAVGENSGEDTFVITGLPESGLLSEEAYYPISALLNGEKVECEWSVSNSKAARISTAKKLKTSDVKSAISFTLTAEHEETGLTATVDLTLVPNAKSIKIEYNGKTQSSFELSAELTNGPVEFALSGVVSPKEAGAALVWTSSDENVATVNSDGLVALIGAGSATITVSTANEKQAEALVSGYYLPESITLDAPEDLAVKDTAKIMCTVYPEKAAQSPLKYVSSDEKTISVNQKGEIKALRAGTCEITVTSLNGISESVTIECYKPVSSLSITDSFYVAVGETKPIPVTVKPDDAKYKELTYYSEKPEVATVDEYGNVTGIKEGTAIIGARSVNGIVTEKSIKVKYVALKSLVNDAFFESLLPGETVPYPVVFNPANATNREVFFESRDPQIASVDENGIITAHTAGRTEIHCEAKSMDPITLIVRVLEDESVLPLEGIIVGINPGHQITRDFTQLPVAPGSSKTKNANSGYVIGVKTKNPEYQVTLDVSMKLKEKLEALGATVVMTRTTNDVKINNIDRAKMLNEAGCDIALQIHCNNSDNERKTGFLVYTKSKDLQSQAIGDYIYIGTSEVAGTEISECKLNDGYMSLNWSTTPAVLLELGYMSNPEEDVLLGTPEYQELLAEGIAKGLVCYFD